MRANLANGVKKLQLCSTVLHSPRITCHQHDKQGVRYNERMAHSPITYSEDAPFTEQESGTHTAHRAAQASNPYERARTQALEPYAAFVSNPQPGALVVVGSSPEILANPTLRTALIASAERFSYTQSDLAWISRETQEKDTPAHLEDKALLHVIETLDPIAVIICDEDSAYACARAYRTHLDLDSATTLLCMLYQSCVSFRCTSRQTTRLAYTQGNACRTLAV